MATDVPPKKRKQKVPRCKPTLDQFIQQSMARGINFPNNAWVRQVGFVGLYVRLTKRTVDMELMSPVLDIANVTARTPGKGTFTKLIKRLRTEYPHLHICVEQTHVRFGDYLVRKLGFVPLNSDIHGHSYFLEAKP